MVRMLRYCPECGKELSRNPKFCPECGKKIIIEEIADRITNDKKSKSEQDINQEKKDIFVKSKKPKSNKKIMTRTKRITAIVIFAIIAFVVLFLLVDVDGDELNNLKEIQHGTSMFNSDSDSDGLSDGNEINVHGTNPLDNDCDKDNIFDGSEIGYGTNPLNSDSDNDGLNDYAEINSYRTNPLNADYDNDGLKDGDEVQLGTDLFNSDTDNDGYKDGSDPHPTTHEWKLIDSDNDGWNDYKEYYETHTDRFKTDTDGDDLKDSSDPHPTEHEWKFQDSDDDGWNDYKEYYETHTDRFKSDTDEDGAPDSMDASPLSAARVITREYKWYYPNEWLYKVTWTWTITVSADLYDYEYKLPRIISWYDWSKYTNDPIIKKLAPGLKSAANNKGFNYYETVNFVLAFVQSLPYTVDSATTGADEYPRYPVETIVDGGGDCEDTSFLVAGLLKEMNYDVCLVLIPGHMAVSVYGGDTYTGSYYTKDDKHYYYCETTGESWKMGQIPSSYSGVSAQLIQVS
jgi:DNA-directed RNA polymerase subunit M/transcription elongation factor TFIIS